MWQRYSAFVTLHKQLEDHYNSLESSHRQVKFPDFPKAHFFSKLTFIGGIRCACDVLSGWLAMV